MSDETGQSSVGAESYVAPVGLGAMGAIPPAAPGSNVAPVDGGLGIFPPGMGDRGVALFPPTPVLMPAASVIPAGLLCLPHQCWSWIHSTGTSITNYYQYQLRMALWEAAPGTGELVFVLEHVYPNPSLPSNACERINVWDSTGTVAVQGSQLSFTTQGRRTQKDDCDPTVDGQWPIGGRTNFLWALDPTHTKLFLTLSFYFGGYNKIILNKVNC